MSNETGKYALLGIAIALSLVVTLSITITTNFYFITQIFPQVIEDKVESIFDEKIEPIVNQTPPQPQPVPPVVTPPVNQTPQPVPTPTPQPVPVPPINNTADNDTVPTPVPIPQPVPTPVPTPQPTPTPIPAKDIRVAITADMEDSDAGTKVFYSIKIGNYDNVFTLGDLGYDDTLFWFKSTYGTLGNKVNCVIGNHESDKEDGNAALEKEAITYCGNSWYVKKNHVLFLGFNTNGDLTKQGNEGASLLQNKDFMTGIKSVHILTHKSCAVPPNSHHPVETKAFCDYIKSKIPSTVTQYWDSGHNHVMSESADKTYKQTGAGGRSHYTCPTTVTSAWWCDNVHFGYLEYTIKPDGTTSSVFKDYNGKVIHQ